MSARDVVGSVSSNFIVMLEGRAFTNCQCERASNSGNDNVGSEVL